MHRSPGYRVYLFVRLFEQYSRRDLTYPTDRPVAVLGLEKRFGQVFKTNWRYGILEKYIHRCLLWHRALHTRMKRIPTKPPHSKVPSWSWMAYTGEIAYMNIALEKVEWSETIQYPYRTPALD